MGFRILDDRFGSRFRSVRRHTLDRYKTVGTLRFAYHFVVSIVVKILKPSPALARATISYGASATLSIDTHV